MPGNRETQGTTTTQPGTQPVTDTAQKKEDSNGARPKGLEGIVIGTSSISLVEGTEGRLSYRGYQIQDLAGNSSFEEVFYMLIHGELPNKQQLTDFEGLMHTRREVPEEAMAVLRVLPQERAADRLSSAP